MADDIGSLVVKVAMDNSNFQQGVQNLNRSMKVIQSEFKNATSGLKEHGKGLEGLKAKQEMLSKSIDVQSKIVQRYKDKLKESKETLSKNAEAQEKLKAKVEDAKKAYEESKTTLGENNAKTKELKTSYEKLSEEYTKNEDKLRNNVRTIDNYTNKTNNAEVKLKGLKRQLDSTNTSIKKQSGKWNELSGKLDKIGNKFDKISKKISGIGTAMSKKISAPIVGAFGLASKKAMDFGDKVAKVYTIADTTKVPIEKLRSGILGLSDQFGISANEIAEAEYQALSASVDTAKVTDFLGVATKSAKGGFTDTATAVNGLTNVLNAYGYEANKAKDISNQMLITQNLGKTTFGELSKSMGKVTPIASALGMKTQELFSSLAVTTAQGLDTAESVTALKASLGNIIKPSKEAQDASEALGISFKSSEIKTKGWMPFLQDLAGKLRQASPELDRLSKLYNKNAGEMAKLEKQGKKNTSMYKGLKKANKGILGDMELLTKAEDSNVGAMATMFGSVEGLNSVLMLTSETGVKKYNESMQEMKTNTHAVEDAYNKMKTPGAQFRKSINKMNNVLIRFGDAITPFVEKLANGISKITDKLNTLTPAQVATITKMAGMTAGIGLLVGGFGKLAGGINNMLTFGSRIATFIGKFKAGETVLNTLIGSIGKLGFVAKAGALLLNPWVAVIAGIGAVGYVTYKHLQKECVPAVDLFADRVQTTTHQIKDANGVITNSYGQTTVKISEATKKAVGSYIELDNKASKSLMDLNANSTKFTDSAKQSVIKNFSDMVQKGSKKGADFNTNITKEFANLINNTGTLTEQNKQQIVSKYSSMALDCEKLSSKQKVDTVNKFKEIFKETTGITQQQKDTLVAQYKEMGAQINAGYDKHYQDHTAKLQKFFDTNTTLTAQEQQEILAKEKSHNDQMKASTNEYTKKINDIIERATNKHRQLSEDELKDISMYRENMKENAIKTLSASEIESKVILERTKSYSTSITTEQASEVIKNAETQRVKTVDEANKEFILKKQAIEEARDVTGSMTKEQAEKAIKNAEKQRDETVKKAGEQKEGVVKQVSQQNADVIKNIDTSNGQIKTKYQVLKEDISKKAHEAWSSIAESFNSGGEKIKQSTHEAIEKIRGKCKEAKTNAKIWGSDIAESLKNGLDSKKESIKAKAEELKSKIKAGFNGLKEDMKSIAEWAVEGLEKGLEFSRKLKEKAESLAQKTIAAVKEKFDIHSPSRKMMELGKFVSEGLALGIVNNKHLAVKASEDLANAVISSTNKIKESTFQDQLGHLLNWGSTEKEPYQDATNFINKLNDEQLEHSKSVLDKEYKFRVENVKNDLKNVKESNAKKLELEKNRVNSQIAYYQKMQKNTKNKNTKNFYANKIDTLKQYLKQYESTIKATQDVTIKKLEVSKNALEKYYAEAKELLKNREDSLKEFMSTTSNFASKLKDALKQSIDEIQKKEEEAIKENINLNDKWKEKTLKAYADVHKTKLENLEEEYRKFEKNTRSETKLLDEQLKKFDSQKADTDDSKKEKELKKILSMNYSKKKKAEAQKELNALIKSRDERHYKESIDQQKEALKEQLDNKKESIDESKKALNKQYEQDKENTEKIYKNNKEMYDNQLDYTKKYYEEQKKEANINARVQQIIIENNQKEIISLLKSTGKEYEITGATLADRFATAFVDKLTVVKDAISDITEQLNNVNVSVNTSNLPRLNAVGGYSTSNISTNKTNVNNNSYGSILHADKIVLNGHKDTQAFAEELEFYRQQASKARGGR
ncbi:tail protein [Clostridium botulinum]|uniref:phage tail tape measure protein n=1 Tax=Clostridium botulinum TaxID=1491 RepID=UPI0002074FEB|nr:phage tail tape measure protein [Clostridium botulinum]AEB77631.1 putative phage tail tape measure protein [Clostridium botulinum BKT015925]KLU74193.1 putative phage tail tape measure protein [Clostridium botulinum V891]KOA86415.1 tail protein [Clostridium botulinum]KOC34084.1 phage tail protein [Clostridium botulinum]KOC42099.1 phage tail protein [Clostridium botulinum]